MIAVNEQSFAEFDPRRYEEEPGLLITEDYRLEIFEIEGQQLRPHPRHREVAEHDVMRRLGMRD